MRLPQNRFGVAPGRVSARGSRGAFFALALGVTIVGVTAAVAWADGERVSLSGTHDEQQFIAGERVHIDAAVSDEIFAAGSEVSFSGASAKTMIAAGHMLTVEASTAQDVIMAGGGLELEANVADDLVAAVCPFCPFSTNRLHVRGGAVIGDDARLASRFVEVDGTVGGDLYALAELFTLRGEVAGNVEVLAERIILAPGARVGGDFAYRSRTEPEIADGVIIAGETSELDAEWFDDIDFEGRDRGGIWSWVVFTLALVVFGAAVLLVAPGLLAAAGATVRRQTWSSLGIGFLVLVVTPIAAALLFISIIGAPLGVFTLSGFAVAMGLGLVTVAYAIAARLRHFAGRAATNSVGLADVLWLAAAMVVLAVIGAIPFLGGLVVLVALLVGLGAVCRQLWQRARTSPAHEPAV